MTKWYTICVVLVLIVKENRVQFHCYGVMKKMKVNGTNGRREVEKVEPGGRNLENKFLS